MAGSTKSKELTATKLMRITQMSPERPDCEFKWFMPHFNVGSLRACYDELDGKKVAGADGMNKEMYGDDLEERILMAHSKARGRKTKEISLTIRLVMTAYCG